MTRAAILGDIAGSRFERSIWTGSTFAEVRHYSDAGESAAEFALFHPDCHATDDSILTLAIMDWLLRGGDPRTHLRAHFRRAPRPELFGKYFRAWADVDSDVPCGSIGNGAAMRVSPVAWAADSATAALRLARASALATHATPDGIAGAEAVALGAFLARKGTPKTEIVRQLAEQFPWDWQRSLDEWRPGYRFTSACDLTVPVAVRAFVEADDFEGTLRRAISMGGDTDTIACMAGALAGAWWGVPAAFAEQLPRYLDAEQMATLIEFEAKWAATQGPD